MRRRALLLLMPALLLAGCAGAPERGPHARVQPDSQRARMVQVARAQIGHPYRYGGADPRHGFDCSGLVYYSHRAAGLDIPRTAREQLHRGRPISPRHLQPGDLLFFSITGKPDHVALYLGDGRFVHAPSRGKRVTTERLDNPWWRRRLVAIRSFLTP